MNKRLWSYGECRKEGEFILNHDPLNPGPEFNDDPACFSRYCNRQANRIRNCGYPLIAQDVLQARDIANPEFRNQARDAGKTIKDGLWVDLS